MVDLRRHRQASGAFGGRQGAVTFRDLVRKEGVALLMCADACIQKCARVRVVRGAHVVRRAVSLGVATAAHIRRACAQVRVEGVYACVRVDDVACAHSGHMLLAERVRKAAERCVCGCARAHRTTSCARSDVVRDVVEKRMGVKLDVNNMYGFGVVEQEHTGSAVSERQRTNSDEASTQHDAGVDVDDLGADALIATLMRLAASRALHTLTPHAATGAPPRELTVSSHARCTLYDRRCVDARTASRGGARGSRDRAQRAGAARGRDWCGVRRTLLLRRSCS
jgi:hypothetical protein